MQPLEFSSKTLFKFRSNLVQKKFKSETVDYEDACQATWKQDYSLIGVKLRMDAKRPNGNSIIWNWGGSL